MFQWDRGRFFVLRGIAGLILLFQWDRGVFDLMIQGTLFFRGTWDLFVSMFLGFRDLRLSLFCFKGLGGLLFLCSRVLLLPCMLLQASSFTEKEVKAMTRKRSGCNAYFSKLIHTPVFRNVDFMLLKFPFNQALPNRPINFL